MEETKAEETVVIEWQSWIKRPKFRTLKLSSFMKIPLVFTHSSRLMYPASRGQRSQSLYAWKIEMNAPGMDIQELKLLIESVKYFFPDESHDYGIEKTKFPFTVNYKGWGLKDFCNYEERIISLLIYSLYVNKEIENLSNYCSFRADNFEMKIKIRWHYRFDITDHEVNLTLDCNEPSLSGGRPRTGVPKTKSKKFLCPVPMKYSDSDPDTSKALLDPFFYFWQKVVNSNNLVIEKEDLALKKLVKKLKSKKR